MVETEAARIIYSGTPPPAAQLTRICIKYTMSEEEVDETGENRMGRGEERAVVQKHWKEKGKILYIHIHQLLFKCSTSLGLPSHRNLTYFDQK